MPSTRFVGQALLPTWSIASTASGKAVGRWISVRSEAAQILMQPSLRWLRAMLSLHPVVASWRSPKTKVASLYAYEVRGKRRFAAIVANTEEVALDATDRWAVEAFASCDPAEFDPSADVRSGYEIWLDADGDRVPTSVLSASAGAEHCDWGSVTFLTVEGATFVADPEGVLGEVHVAATFDDDAELPADAVDTGYYRGSKHLWLAADGRVAFVVDRDTVQAWPALTQPLACA